MAELALTPELITTVQQNLICTYVDVSAISFLIHDIIFNLDREIKYVWRARWSPGTVLFIFGRYYGLLFNIIDFVGSATPGLSYNFCRGYFWYMALGGEIFFTTVVNIILTMRLYAVYRNRKVLVMFITMITCEFAIELYVCLTMGIEMYTNVYAPPPGYPLPGCLVNHSINERITILSWILGMIISTVFFFMTIVKVLSDGYRITFKDLLDVRHVSPILVQIVRDGALFYFMMFAIALIGLVVMQTAEGMMVNMPMPWIIAIYSLSASHLVLNLREAASRHTFGGNTTAGFRSTIGPVFALNTIGETVTTVDIEILP